MDIFSQKASELRVDTFLEISRLRRARDPRIFVLVRSREMTETQKSKNSKICTFSEICTFLGNLHIFMMSSKQVLMLLASEPVLKLCVSELFRSRIIQFRGRSGWAINAIFPTGAVTPGFQNLHISWKSAHFQGVRKNVQIFRKCADLRFFWFWCLRDSPWADNHKNL